MLVILLITEHKLDWAIEHWPIITSRELDRRSLTHHSVKTRTQF